MTDNTRTLEQNKLMWSLLHDLATQVVWHGDRLTDVQWKRAMMAGMPGGQGVTMIKNPHGAGFIDVGSATSKLRVSEMAELIEIIVAFGTERGVTWKLLPPAVISVDDYRLPARAAGGAG